MKLQARFCLFVLLTAWGCDESSGGGGRTVPEKQPPLEQQLAMLRDGREVRPNEPIVKRFGKLLDSLDAKFPETRNQIADMSVATVELMRNKGVDEDLLTLMEEMDQMKPSHDAGMTYADTAAAYATLRVMGTQEGGGGR